LFDSGSYALGGIDNDGGRSKRLIDAAVNAFNDAAWRKEAAKRSETPGLTKLPAIVRKAAPADLGLPKGSQLYEFNISDTLVTEIVDKGERPAGKANAISFYMLVVTDETRTWFGYGVDKSAMATGLKQVLNSTPTGNLAQRPGLEAWRKEAAISGGFWTVAELFESIARYANMAKASSEGEAPLSSDTLALAMPSKGKVPVRYSLKIEPGPMVWMSFIAPSAAVEDFASGTVAVVAQMGDIF
jgi:hypothetical protein